MMMSRLFAQAGKSLTITPRFTYIEPPKHSETHHHVLALPLSPVLLPSESSSVSTRDSTSSTPSVGT